MKIVVTGGNGTMGRALLPYLLEQGHQVVSVDRALPADAGPLAGPNLQFQVADTTDFGQMVACLRGCQGVVHLAAHISPLTAPEPVVYTENTAGSYNVLCAAATLGIQRVCLASSINAIGGVFSQWPRYDYFPLDEQHPGYAEDAYSLSKWVLEQQADAFARRYSSLSIASLRFHWLTKSREHAQELSARFPDGTVRHLWAYTLASEAARACLLALTADFKGHEAFYIVAPRTTAAEESAALAAKHFPQTPIRGSLPGQAGFFNCAKAEQILGWRHAA
ncbi:MAG: NAD(P)-dependent oxidoreductase [Anaerolineales bacterium]